MSRRVLTLVAVGALLVGATEAVATTGAPAVEPSAQGTAAPLPPADTTSALGPDDLEVVAETWVSDRALDITFETPALDAPTTVRVMLPEGYDPAGTARYPVLFLLHGGAGRYTDWSASAQALTQDLPLITVMPDAGRSAWYTDWYNNGAGGTPMWETYHVRQLVPWIDQRFATTGARSGRAIAGLSSGGFGTMSYASRHPDLFVAAAAFSGALDTNTPPVVAGKVIDVLAAQDRGGPGSLFGLRETEEVRWRGHNPWDLAPNFGSTALVVRAGNGMSGGEFGGGGPTDPVGFALEKATYDQSVSFHERLDVLGIDHVWDSYGPGTHSWPYWHDGLAKSLPLLMQVFGEERPDPSPFSHRAIEPEYEVYGWRVVMDRPVTEFSSIEGASTAGFTLTGSGAATVTTPPVYVPRKAYAVTMRNGDGGTVASVVEADGDGRLTLPVALGPPNLVQQQFTPTHESPATTVHATSVSIERVRPGRRPAVPATPARG